MIIWNITDSNNNLTNEKIRKFCISKTNVTLLEKTKSEDNGLYDSWNKMLDIVDTELVCNYNADDKLHPDYLIDYIKEFDNNNNINLVCSPLMVSKNIKDNFRMKLPLMFNDKMIFYNSKEKVGNYELEHMNLEYKMKTLEDYKDGKIKVSKKRVMFKNFTIFDFFNNNGDILKMDDWIPRNLVGCAPMWRKSLYDKYGGFNEEEFKGAADFDLWLRFFSNEGNFKKLDKPYVMFYMNRNSYFHRENHYEVHKKLVEKYLNFNSITIISSLCYCDNYIDYYIKNIQNIKDLYKYDLLIYNLSDSNNAETNYKINSLKKYIPKIKIFNKKKSDDNGLYKSWEFLVKKSLTKYIINLNPDDKIHTNYLNISIEKIKNEKLDIITSTCYVSKNYKIGFNDNLSNLEKMYIKKPYFTNEVTNDPSIIEFNYLKNKIQNKLKKKWDKWHSNYINIYDLFNGDNLFNFFGCCPIFNKNLLYKFGFWDEKNFGPSADAEFWLRCIKNGARSKIITEPYIIYYLNEKSYARKNNNNIEYNKLINNLYNPYIKLKKIYTNHYYEQLDNKHEITIKNICNYNLYCYDNDWQYPVITEKKVFELFNENNDIPCNYLAFPWASLIDFMVKKQDNNLLKKLGNLKVKSPCFTVCQHIRFRTLLKIFNSIGITHVFASHNSKYDNLYEEKFNIKILPFQLYPINFKNNENIKKTNNYKTSFMGSYHPKYYLSSIRYDLKKLKNVENYIKLKDEWHFSKIVYDKQINKKEIKDEDKVDLEIKTIEFKDLLNKSKFSLCPSGSGPNSIRLWESLSYGSIPILLSNDLKLNEMIEWSNYIIIWDENKILELPDFLNTIPHHKYILMKNNCIRLFNDLFHPNKFNETIKMYFENIKGKHLFISNNYLAHYECIETLIVKYKEIIKKNINFDKIYLRLHKDTNWEFGNLNKYSFIKYIKNKYPEISFYIPKKYEYFIETTYYYDSDTYQHKDKHFYLSHRFTKNYESNIFYISKIFDKLPYCDDSFINENIPIYLVIGDLTKRNISELKDLIQLKSNKKFKIRILSRSITICENLKQIDIYNRLEIFNNLYFEEFHKKIVDCYCILFLLYPFDYDNKFTGAYSICISYNKLGILRKENNKIFNIKNALEYEENFINIFNKSLELYEEKYNN